VIIVVSGHFLLVLYERRRVKEFRRKKKSGEEEWRNYGKILVFLCYVVFLGICILEEIFLEKC